MPQKHLNRPLDSPNNRFDLFPPCFFDRFRSLPPMAKMPEKPGNAALFRWSALCLCHQYYALDVRRDVRIDNRQGRVGDSGFRE